MALKLDVSRAEDIVIVRCRGRIIFGEEADELRRTILGLLNETKRIVLNLAGVSHIDSCGLGTLVASFISARNHEAEIKFAALSPKARRVLGITKVRQLFERCMSRPKRRLNLSILAHKPLLGDLNHAYALTVNGLFGN